MRSGTELSQILRIFLPSLVPHGLKSRCREIKLQVLVFPLSFRECGVVCLICTGIIGGRGIAECRGIRIDQVDM